jgi:hypothetical protein
MGSRFTALLTSFDVLVCPWLSVTKLTYILMGLDGQPNMGRAKFGRRSFKVELLIV